MQGFTYQLCLDIDSGKLRRYKVAKTFFGDVKMSRVGSEFHFHDSAFSAHIATIAADDTITLHVLNQRVADDQTIQNRWQTLLNYPGYGVMNSALAHDSRWFIGSCRSSHRQFAQPVRILRGLWWKRAGEGYVRNATMPLTSGMQFRHGVLLNPEIAQDKVLRTDRDAVAVVKAKTEKLRKVVKVLVRMGAVHQAIEQPDGTPRAPSVASLIDNLDDIDAGAVTAMLAREVHSWFWNRWDADARDEHVRAAEDRFMRRVRDALYEEMGARSYVAVEASDDHAQDLQRAA
jgi:hypothetical protein